MTIRHHSRCTPRRARVIAAVGALFALLAMAGCSHPVLGRPALLGASVTAGAGAAVSPGVLFDSVPTDQLVRGERSTGTAPPLAVDAAVAFSAVVTAPHETPLNLGDGGVFLDSDMALRDQAKAAAAWRPSVVIAVDWLFWPVHQAISLELPAEERAARRLASVDAALADLDAFSCPIVIGDVPEMRRAVGGLLRAEHDPGAAVRAQANERLATWASARPNRFVLAVSALADAVNRGAPIEIAVIASWATLPAAIKVGIMAMVPNRATCALDPAAAMRLRPRAQSRAHGTVAPAPRDCRQKTRLSCHAVLE